MQVHDLGWVDLVTVLVTAVMVVLVVLLHLVYFSAITYTTVGYGNFVPTGPIRFMCGMEALMALTLVTWSASSTFLEMQRYWGRD